MVQIIATDFTPRVIRNRRLHNGYTVIAAPETLGQRIRRLRLEHGWTQSTLAERANIGRASIAHYEGDRREPFASALYGMARAFGVSMEALWRGGAS